MQKSRVLCLHGYTQNGTVFSNKIGSTRKLLKNHCEFIFIDAPYLVDGNESQKSWWVTTEKPSASASYEGFSQSLRLITQALIKNQPVDAILGFSQGSTATALFLSFIEQYKSGTRQFSFLNEEDKAFLNSHEVEESLNKFSPKFSILVSGFMPRDPEYIELLQTKPISIPTFHVYGSGDTLVVASRTKELSACFDSPVLFEHPGGHMVPTGSGDYKTTLIKFIESSSRSS